jgi:hypothetical protein
VYSSHRTGREVLGRLLNKLHVYVTEYTFLIQPVSISASGLRSEVVESLTSVGALYVGDGPETEHESSRRTFFFNSLCCKCNWSVHISYRRLTENRAW